jgi:ABC transporter with metal-binding/Fe-S-binding domain ATP-binding protein
MNNMNLAALYSGGKDSTYALYRAIREGNQVSCLITILPDRDDSLFFHYQNAYCTLYQAECLGLPLISTKARCESKERELDALEQALTEAKQTFAIDGVVTGGLASRFQRKNFQRLCEKIGLRYYSPIWDVDQAKYMCELVENNFVIMIVGVSAAGLDEKWLGRILDQPSLNELENLSKKHGFSIAFEGGEAETFVLDCPIFKNRLQVRSAKKHWDGVRGYYEILDLATVSKS